MKKDISKMNERQLMSYCKDLIDEYKRKHEKKFYFPKKYNSYGYLKYLLLDYE